jgi:hypothetical protein
MLTNQEPDWNIDDLSDTDICAAIRYLDADLKTEDKQHADAQRKDKDNGVVICVCLYTLLLGCLAFLWFYWR